ncbi:hypothetical protein RHMOL_Rhmol09G0038400 [Rhododendron molle]|uniref:Uncharacterized protein n=1 Tax=Rhododendron molle TaxID=49168 RepID=A0ACC0MB38_RHOML|nr:hypothetical protein RHMOL_Rhmol09G0038400 [Rhododendron molle]
MSGLSFVDQVCAAFLIFLPLWCNLWQDYVQDAPHVGSYQDMLVGMQMGKHCMSAQHQKSNNIANNNSEGKIAQLVECADEPCSTMTYKPLRNHGSGEMSPFFLLSETCTPYAGFFVTSPVFIFQCNPSPMAVP